MRRPPSARGPIRVHAADAALGGAVLAPAEGAAARISQWAGDGARTIPVTIFVLPSERDFLALTGAISGTAGLTLREHGATSRRRTILTYEGAPDLLETIIPHEMTHALATSDAGEGFPLFLSEGLAVASEPEAARARPIERYRRALGSTRIWSHTCPSLLPPIFAREQYVQPEYTHLGTLRHEFDIEVGAMAGLVNFRVGLSPGELLDAVLGIFTIDLAGDDRGEKPPIYAPPAAAAPAAALARRAGAPASRPRATRADCRPRATTR